MSEADFWRDQTHARAVTAEHDAVQKELAEWESLSREAADLLELASADQADQSVSLRTELEQQYGQLLKRLEALEFKKLLGQKY